MAPEYPFSRFDLHVSSLVDHRMNIPTNINKCWYFYPMTMRESNWGCGILAWDRSPATRLLQGSEMRIVKRLLAIVVLPLGLAACDGGESQMLESEFTSRISSNDIPASVEQGIEVLGELLSDETNRRLVLCNRKPIGDSCRDFSINFRIPLQRRISNEWIRPSGSAMRAQMNQDGLADPEEMVSKFMRLYIRSLEATIE